MSDTLNFVLAHPNEAADRIEALETALREIKDQYLAPEQSSAIARKALAPARQENDDVFPGFRGNNDYA
jgi:hypothetical protein